MIFDNISLYNSSEVIDFEKGNAVYIVFCIIYYCQLNNENCGPKAVEDAIEGYDFYATTVTEAGKVTKFYASNSKYKCDLEGEDIQLNDITAIKINN